MTIDDIRAIVTSFEGVTEEPHHHLVSFRVKNKIIATMPADGSFLNIFVSDF